LSDLKVGVFYDVPFEEYLSWDAISNSRMGLAKKSGLHFKYGFKGEPTNAMRLGSLVHTGVLEPLAIAKRYCFMPDYASDPRNTTKSGERSFSSATTFVRTMEEAYRSLNNDKTIVSEDEYNKMIGLVGGVSANTIAKDLLSRGSAEVSIVWIDEATGLNCKIRADWLCTEGEVVVDLKTTQDASNFEKSIVNFGYHRQMAFYLRGIKQVLNIDVVPWIIAIESSAPYGCRTAPMDSEALAIGQIEVDELLQFIAECKATDVWPGYTNPASWSVPNWYKKTDSDPFELTIEGEVLTV
jgi:hypothetical protein